MIKKITGLKGEEFGELVMGFCGVKQWWWTYNKQKNRICEHGDWMKIHYTA